MFERVVKSSLKSEPSIRRSMKRPREPETTIASQLKCVKIEEHAEIVAEPKNVQFDKRNVKTVEEKPVIAAEETPAVVKSEPNTTLNESDVNMLNDDDDMDFSILDDEENQFEHETSVAQQKKDESIAAAKAKQKETENENYANVVSAWENCEAIADDDDELLGSVDIDVVEKKSTINFWYWDAYEDPIKLPGKVFLFGRMPIEGNSREYKSVCVTIEKVNRCLYLLPRKYVSIHRGNVAEKYIFIGNFYCCRAIRIEYTWRAYLFQKV